MALTLGTAPFGPAPEGRFNFERTGAAHVLYWEPWPRRLRAEFAGETVADSRDALALHETGLLPAHYFPRFDVRFEYFQPTQHTTHCPFKGDARYWSVVVGERTAENAVWAYPDPTAGAPPLRDYVAFDYGAMERWWEEDEEIYAHPRDPYHRVDVRAGSRHVVVRSGGLAVARSEHPKLLFETGLPVRYYLPPDDVDRDRLLPSHTVSQCPYKGDGQHWHLQTDDGSIEDAAWSLPNPLPEGLGAAGHFCFYPDKVEIEVDGEPLKESST